MTRRYDIDYIRIIAIALLLIYHLAIGFQSWGIMIGFIANDKSWPSLWIPMAMLNVWRIPLLFFVSGMGVCFAMRNRNWKQLMIDRTMRIGLPFVFGMFCLVPVHMYIWQTYYKMQTSYQPNPGHLWFLGNIMVYVLVLSPVFFYLKRNEDGSVVRWIRSLLSTPLGLIPVVAVFVAEAETLKPMPYELYAMTWHGFVLGLFAFFFGFCFVISGDSFWKMIQQWRWMFLIVAAALFAVRMVLFQMAAPYYQLVPESQCWILCVFAFGSLYLNRPGKTLTYLSEAAYPVYILHMIFLFLASEVIFKMNFDVHLQFVAVLLLTMAGCFGTYEIIRRVKFLRVLFGQGWKR